jgi:hypothetical protein
VQRVGHELLEGRFGSAHAAMGAAQANTLAGGGAAR